ncbi:MAG: ABC transporter permease [Candidatus Hodarchaeota archaeon]
MSKKVKFSSYLAVSKISFRNVKKYTVDFLTSFAYFPAQIIALYFVYSIVYAQTFLIDGATVIGGFTFAQLINYLFIAIIMQRALPRWRLSTEIEKDIDRGPLVSYLARPIDYAGFKLFGEFPRSFLYLLFGLITYLITLLFIPLPVPALVNLLLFVPFFLVAYILAFLLVFATSLAAFKMSQIWWIRNLLGLTMTIAGGGLIPMSFFPPLLQGILLFLPFQYCYYTPAIILQGYYTVEGLIVIALISVGWLVILWLLTRGLWNLGRRGYSGAGG